MTIIWLYYKQNIWCFLLTFHKNSLILTRKDEEKKAIMLSKQNLVVMDEPIETALRMKTW